MIFLRIDANIFCTLKRFVDLGDSIAIKTISIINLLLYDLGTKSDTTKSPFLNELYKSITNYMGVEISESPVFIDFYRCL